jgi:hypothetical protein
MVTCIFHYDERAGNRMPLLGTSSTRRNLTAMRRLFQAAAHFGALACVALAGCRPGEAARPLIIIVSGDTAGWIVPCGCTSNQSGGLPRRAACLAAMRRGADVLALDAGGAAHGTSPYDAAKFKAILQGEAAMGAAAHNIGAAEAGFGPETLRRLALEAGATLISANVRDAAGRPVAEPMRIVSIAGRRIAIVGVLSERYATAELRVSPPQQAALESLRAATGKYDAAVVLAYLPEEELRQLAESLPEADIVAGGPTGQPIAPKQIGPTLLTSATHKGKFLARLDALAPGSKERWRGNIVELDEQFADDPEQTAVVSRFRDALARADFSPRQTSFVSPLPPNLPKGYSIAGTEACRKCHEDDCRLWGKSTHATAWKSLEAKGAHVDPECQRCHSTGYGLPGGFASLKDAARVNVGCESCHGPCGGHAADSDVHTAYFGQAKNSCATCHDRENSPKFEYEAYWKKIFHGEEKGKSP